MSRVLFRTWWRAGSRVVRAGRTHRFRASSACYVARVRVLFARCHAISRIVNSPRLESLVLSRVRFARVTRCLRASRVSARRRIILFACCLRVVDFPSRVRAAHLDRVSRAVRARY